MWYIVAFILFALSVLVFGWFDVGKTYPAIRGLKKIELTLWTPVAYVTAIMIYMVLEDNKRWYDETELE